MIMGEGSITKPSGWKCSKKMKVLTGNPHLAVERAEDLEAIEVAISGVQESLRASQLVIGYRSNGRPVLKQNFLGRLLHSLQDIQNDEYISLASFEERSADW